MNRIRLAATVLVSMALIAGCSAAFATGYVPADPGLQQSQDQWQKQQQAQQQAQQASSSVGNVSAQGTGKASADGGNSSLSDNSVSETRAKALGLTFAPGAFTPSMPATGARFPSIKQSARNLGFGLASIADAETNTDVDSMYAMREIKLAQCQYLTVKQIDDGIIKRAMPDYIPASDAGYANLSPEECALQKSPPAAGIKPAEQATVAERLAPKKACANPKRYDVPCARPGGIRKDDGCCYYACAGKS